jgi:hypothetical protein
MYEAARPDTSLAAEFRVRSCGPCLCGERLSRLLERIKNDAARNDLGQYDR